jgi:hypothetical protein
MEEARIAYWYYKLQATSAIFLTKIKGKFTKYKHLGKAGKPNGCKESKY